MSYSMYGRTWPNSFKSVALTLLCHLLNRLRKKVPETDTPESGNKVTGIQAKEIQ